MNVDQEDLAPETETIVLTLIEAAKYAEGEL